MFASVITMLMEAKVTLPAFEVAILIGVLSICSIFELTRAGLVVAYIFAYRWGWLFFAGQSEPFLRNYLILGCAVGALAIVGLYQAGKANKVDKATHKPMFSTRQND